MKKCAREEKTRAKTGAGLIQTREQAVSDKPARNYGAVAWPKELLEKLYNCPVDNDDPRTNPEIVDGWVKYFGEHAKHFREHHSNLIKRAE